MPVIRRFPSLALLPVLILLLGGGASGQNGGDCESVESGAVSCLIPLAEDTLFFLENRGVTRILVDLNGHHFKLATDPAEVEHSQNAFPIPLFGELTIDIGRYMLPGFDTNVISLLTQGPSGTDWRFVIAPEYVEGQTGVAYAIEGLVPLPAASRLLQNYPNPFRTGTTFTFHVPEDRITGLALRLDVYDVSGRLIRRLVDAHHFPGSFAVVWDGRDASGVPAGAGVYVARLAGDRFVHSVRVVRVP